MSVRTKLATALAAAALACTAAPALAGGIPDAKYEGRIAGDPNTYIGHGIKRAKGKRFLTKLYAVVPFTCRGSAYVDWIPMRIKGRIPVRENGKFAATRKAVGVAVPGHVKMRVKLRGRLAKGGRTQGRIEANGRILSEARAGTLAECYSGMHDWRARRGADVDPFPPDRR